MRAAVDINAELAQPATPQKHRRKLTADSSPDAIPFRRENEDDP